MKEEIFRLTKIRQDLEIRLEDSFRKVRDNEDWKDKLGKLELIRAKELEEMR